MSCDIRLIQNVTIIYDIISGSVSDVRVWCGSPAPIDVTIHAYSDGSVVNKTTQREFVNKDG